MFSNGRQGGFGLHAKKCIVFTIMGEITIEEELSLFCTVEPCRIA